MSPVRLSEDGQKRAKIQKTTTACKKKRQPIRRQSQNQRATTSFLPTGHFRERENKGMTRDEALSYIHEHSWDYITETWGRDRNGKGWVCPLCGSGSHGEGTGITTKDGVHFTCWAGCFTNADVIDIVGLLRGIPQEDHEAKFEAARQEFGIVVDAPLITAVTDEPESFEIFFLEANQHLCETDYHRGISLDTLNRFNVGYIGNWRHPKASNCVSASPRLIIPLNSKCYLARDTRSNLTLEQSRYKKQLVGSRGGVIFNGDVLRAAKGPVFVTEGELDAMSVIDVGGEAVTAGSAGQWRNVFEAVKAHPQPYPVIVALDNDKTGGERGRDLKEAFMAEGIAFTDYTPPMGAKDANEALMKDRAVFAESVRAAMERAMRLNGEQRQEEHREYLPAASASLSLQALVGRIKARGQTCPLSTGFSALDSVLNGGFRTGLYVLGAIQSLGKTAFCMQMMDGIAAAGNDVLVFSLEMSRDELVARSVSRITYELSVEAGQPGRMAYNALELLSGSWYGRDGQEGEARIMEAVKAYSRYSDNVFIFEGIGDVTAGQMLETTQRHIQLTGHRPVVLCDYLQIVPTANARSRTDKQNIDYNVVALKRMSRDLSIPVIVISSFNRQNYLEPLNPSAFKESGAVEYSADVLIGIQYQGMEYRLGDEKEAQRARRIGALMREWEKLGRIGKPQGLHLKVMKNRTGYKDSACFNYYPAFNFFECDLEADKREQHANDEWEQFVKDEARANGRCVRAR